MCISFQPGLGNGLLCDWRVLWNLCALGQVNTLIHSPPAESALSVLILFFPSFRLFLLASVFHIHLHACLLPSLNDPALVELFLLSIQTDILTHPHTYIEGRGVWVCSVCVPCTMRYRLISHPCTVICIFYMFSLSCFLTQQTGAHAGSLLCNMPDGERPRDQAVRRAYVPGSLPSLLPILHTPRTTADA